MQMHMDAVATPVNATEEAELPTQNIENNPMQSRLPPALGSTT
ncbi:hypothetical protein [Bradyrhizobium pachyrhizi]|nr:hypothetical protein [Bradyrhizobium pachyrhizi]